MLGIICPPPMVVTGITDLPKPGVVVGHFPLPPVPTALILLNASVEMDS